VETAHGKGGRYAQGEGGLSPPTPQKREGNVTGFESGQRRSNKTWKARKLSPLDPGDKSAENGMTVREEKSRSREREKNGARSDKAKKKAEDRVCSLFKRHIELVRQWKHPSKRSGHFIRKDRGREDQNLLRRPGKGGSGCL